MSHSYIYKHPNTTDMREHSHTCIRTCTGFLQQGVVVVALVAVVPPHGASPSAPAIRRRRNGTRIYVCLCVSVFTCVSFALSCLFEYAGVN
jgi:hypothetical protein